MQRKQFTFYRSYLDSIRHQPLEEQKTVILAICDYALNETEPENLSPLGVTIFELVRPTIDDGRKKAGKRIAKNQAH